MPPPKVTDEKGYYRLLKVSPDASADELRLAFAMARQTAEGPRLRRIDEAFETLRDPERRRAYDALGRKPWSPLKSPLTLAAAVALLIAVFALLWLPGIQMRRKSFSPGQTLVETRTGREFGVVVRYDPGHAFPGGAVAPAYLVEEAEGGPERWYPAIDLQSTCEPR